MRILQVITSLHIGGAEKLIVDMSPLYQKKGMQVDVLLFDGTETPLKQELQENGIQVFHLGIGGRVYNPFFILKLIPFLRHYDIIHTHNTACQYFTALAKCFSFSKVKLVTTEHSTTNRRRNITWFRIIDKFVYSQYNIIISISHAVTDMLRQYSGYAYPIETIPNGINIPLFQQAESLDRSTLKLAFHSCLVTMVAGFREEKDQDTLIRAISHLPASYKLCLVGDGVRRQICETLVKNLGLEDRVVFAGIRSDIPQILKASDIIVVSSHWEGFGLVAVEGMAAGKPVIASNVSGLADVVREAGILFPQGDEKTLANIIERLMNDKSFYRQTAEQCMQRALEYDIQKTVDAYENVYKKTMHIIP